MTRRHPTATVVRDALRDQPDLTFLCTFQPDDVVAAYGAHRVLRMPVAESAMVGMGVGMALRGRRALVNLARAAFLFSAMDPLVNQAATWRYSSGGQFSVPLVVRAMTRGGEDLGAQHEHAPHALLAQVPGLTVVVPGSPNSAAGLLATALRHPDPVVVLESPRLFAAGWDALPEPEPTPSPLPFGRAGRAAAGTDVTLVGLGGTVALCLLAAAALAGRGVSAQVVDLRTAAPLDRDGTAGLVAGTGGAVLVDEGPPTASIMHDLGLHLVRAGAVDAERLAVLTGSGVPAPVSPVLQAGLQPEVPGVVAAALGVTVPVGVR